MTPSASALRYERKFVVPDRPLPEVLALVRRHPALFREAYPPRWVNNVYLDTPTRDDYLAHVHGTANRMKTRIRWYGELRGRIASPTLERKLKRGLVSGKESHGLGPIEHNGALPARELEATFDHAALPPLWRAALRHREPALLNRYHRHYFVSADGRFRLTADSDLQYFAWNRATGSLTPAPRAKPVVVLELKFTTDHAAQAEGVTNALPFRLARCSKYVLGIERLHEL